MSVSKDFLLGCVLHRFSGQHWRIGTLQQFVLYKNRLKCLEVKYKLYKLFTITTLVKRIQILT